MADKPKKKDEAPKPTIAWDRLGIMESLELAEMEEANGEIQILSQLVMRGQATIEQTTRLLELRDPIRQREHISRQMTVMAKFVTDVPREWLVAGAPTDIDWSDGESYKYLRTTYFRILYQSLMFGSMSGADITKN